MWMLLKGHVLRYSNCNICTWLSAALFYALCCGAADFFSSWLFPTTSGGNATKLHFIPPSPTLTPPTPQLLLLFLLQWDTFSKLRYVGNSLNDCLHNHRKIVWTITEGWSAQFWEWLLRMGICMCTHRRSIPHWSAKHKGFQPQPSVLLKRVLSLNPSIHLPAKMDSLKAQGEKKFLPCFQSSSCHFFSFSN